MASGTAGAVQANRRTRQQRRIAAQKAAETRRTHERIQVRYGGRWVWTSVARGASVTSPPAGPSE